MAGFLLFKDSPIKGEVTQDSQKDGAGFYQGWIELNSVTETVTRAIETGRSGSARARAGTVLEEIEVEKEMDRTTVDLINAVSGGTAFPEVQIHLVTSLAQEVGGAQALHPYLEMRLFSCKVTSYNMNGSGLDDGSIPTETLSLNFDKILWTYWPIGPMPEDLNAPANKVWDQIVSGWDILKQGTFTG